MFHPNNYYNYIKNENNQFDDLKSQYLNNTKNDDNKLLGMFFESNKNDDEESYNNNELYYLKSTGPKTNKEKQEEINIIGSINNFYNDEEEQSKGLIIRGGENMQTLLYKENKIKKELSEKIEKEVNKNSNNIQIVIKKNQEDEKEGKKIFDKIKMPPKHYCINDINNLSNSIIKKEIIIKNDNILELENKVIKYF